MAAVLQPQKRIRPSDRTIAFAVSIVQSKPAELTIAEYIALLRQHVARGRRENAISSAYRHLDRSSYWRAEYERLRVTLKAAEDETTDLQRELASLNVKLASSKQASPTKKRKRPDAEIIPVPRSPKRTRANAARVKNLDDPQLEDELEFSILGESGDELIRTLFHVRRVMTSRGKVEAALLAHKSVRAAKALPQVLQQAVQHHQAETVSNDELQMVLSACTRATCVLLKACKHSSIDAGAFDVRGRVVYAYVHMFGNLLDTLDLASAMEVEIADRIEPASAVGKKQTASKSKTALVRSTNVKDNLTLNRLTAFLCQIIDSLEASSDAHSELFEGFAYLILEKLGSCLYTLCFGHLRANTIEGEIARSEGSTDIEQAPIEAESSPENLQLRALKLKAPYLVHLLNHVMNAAPAHLGAVISSRTGKPKQANNKGSMKGALMITAKERLQRTLVNSMFGTEGNNENDPFMDCLKMPVLKTAALPGPKVQEAEVPEWFQEQVWRLLGWEILARDGAC